MLIQIKTIIHPIVNFVKKLFKDYVGRFVDLQEEESVALEKIMHYRKIGKKEVVAQAGKICTKVLFTARGYFRFYHYDANGNEITSDFYFAPAFISAYTSFITGEPSFVNVQAMMDMDVLEFQKNDLYNLYGRFPKIETLGRMIAESVAINSEHHLFMLLNQTAEMRYKSLLEKNPEYVRTIPMQYIASYLGITKETLSRIRKTAGR